MKTRILSFIIAAILLTACSASSSTAKKEKAAAEFELTAALVESGNYMFTVRSASPSGGKVIQITSQYALTATEGKYEAYLPYFGKAYSASYGGNGGIEFDGEPEDLQITRDDNKLIISVSFTIQAEKDRYEVKLDVGSSGYGNLVISSAKRQTISYSGQAGEIEN